MDWIVIFCLLCITLLTLSRMHKTKFSNTVTKFETIGKNFQPVPNFHQDFNVDMQSIRKQILKTNGQWEFEISYQEDSENVVVTRVRELRFGGKSNPVLTAFCEMNDAERSFRYCNIVKCINLQTGASIKGFETYLNAA